MEGPLPGARIDEFRAGTVENDVVLGRLAGMAAVMEPVGFHMREALVDIAGCYVDSGELACGIALIIAPAVVCHVSGPGLAVDDEQVFR